MNTYKYILFAFINSNLTQFYNQKILKNKFLKIICNKYLKTDQKTTNEILNNKPKFIPIKIYPIGMKLIGLMNYHILVFLIIFYGCLPKKSNLINNKVEKPSWVKSQKNSYKPSKTREIDIINTTLEANFDWKNKTMAGTATIKLKPFYYELDTITLDAKYFIIDTIKIINHKNNYTLKYLYDNKKIKITIGRKLTKNDTISILIKYTAQPEIYAKNTTENGTAISDSKGLFFITPDSAHPTKPYQIWTQGETESTSCWLPTTEATNEKFTQDFYLTVSKKMKTLSNGELIYSIDNQDTTRTDYWRQTLPHAPYLAMIAVGDFEIIKDKYKQLDVDYYVEPKYGKYGKKIFGKTPEMIAFFEKILNYSYPWNKYSSIVVRDYVSGAMENTSATVFMEQVQRTDRELLDLNYDNVLAHELFHHWFGDLVTCESWANLPLNESFADYSEYLWEEYKYGLDAADLQHHSSLDQYLWESKTKREPLIRYHHKEPDDMFDSHSYAKGGLVLHALRNYVGDKAFFESLNLYLTKNAFKTTEIHDLRMAFEETTGKDLNWFFDQWFLKRGHPEIEVKSYYKDGKFIVKTTQNQDTLYQPIYKIPYEIIYYIDKEEIKKNITLDAHKNTFEFDCKQKPDVLLFDTKDIHIGTIQHYKSKKEYIFQYYNAKKYIFRYAALSALKNDLDSNDILQMYKDATQDSFWKIREMAIETLSKANKKDSAEVTKLMLACYDKEKKPDVKAIILEKIGNKKDKNFAQMFAFCMRDSSYMVAGAALKAYLQTNPDNANETIKIFENENNIEINVALAEYYSTKNDSSYFEWFKQKISSQEGNGEGKYALLQEFGTYGLKLSPNYRKKVADILIFQAQKATSAWTRYGAMQSLLKLETIDKSYKSDIERIKKAETNKQLKLIYED